jgi:[ribosomal protein S5]-alanine N-acetyltransferase
MPLLPEVLETARLKLRKPRFEDASAIFNSYGRDPKVAHYMIWHPHTEIGQTQEFIRDCIEAWRGADRLPYILTLRGEDTAIGMLDARLHGHMIDIGYVLARQNWGNGLMPEAISSMAKESFACSHVFRLQATCDVDNAASVRTLEKAGFTREGRLEMHTIHPNISQVPRACYMYALCRSAA